MSAKARPLVAKIFAQWRSEDRGLEMRVDEVIDWMHAVSEKGIPHFGETAARLRPLRDRLVVHFKHEGEMIANLAQHYPTPSPEIEAVQRQARRDHEVLLERLDSLIGRLGNPVPPFESWQAAIAEVGAFLDELEQHEEQETESIQMLMPTE